MLHILTDLVPLIVRNAPMLAGSLFSPMAGAAVDMICQAFGTDPEKPEELMESIKNDPGAEGKLQALEQVHRAKMNTWLGFTSPTHAEIIIKLDWSSQPQT